MNCSDYQELISAWIDRELSRFEEKKLIDHLDKCPDCRVFWKSMTEIQNQAGQISDPDIPSGLWDQIMTKLDKNLAKRSEEGIVLLPTAYGRMIPTKKGEGDAEVFNLSSAHQDKQNRRKAI